MSYNAVTVFQYFHDILTFVPQKPAVFNILLSLSIVIYSSVFYFKCFLKEHSVDAYI